MNITSNTIDDTNLTSLIIEKFNEDDLINTTITTITTKLILTKTTSTFFRLFNTTKSYSFLRSPLLTTTPSISSLLNKYFLFKTLFNRIMRSIELCILSLALPIYAIVFILFIELTVLRINKNLAISGGDSRIRSQRRRQRMHSLIWTSNYLLIDFFNLLYELTYVIVHLTGLLSLESFTGQFYCNIEIYLPSYLTVLMAYSLTAISISRRRHFVNLNNQITQSTKKSLIMISTLWIMPILTSVIPTYLLIYLKIFNITQHKTTNQCQISYTYGSNIEIVYIFYRLGNIFFLPITISLACYLTIYVDIIRMQRRFSKTFKRHILTRKNLITQILFLFLNFAVFWLPAELIMLYPKNFHVIDALQVTKSLNIFLDPIIIITFDTRFSSAAQQLLSKCPFNEFMCFFNANRRRNSSITSHAIIKKRLKRSSQTTSQKMTTTTTRNIANNDDITVLESITNHLPQRPRIKQELSFNEIQSRNNQRRLTQKRMKNI